MPESTLQIKLTLGMITKADFHCDAYSDKYSVPKDIHYRYIRETGQIIYERNWEDAPSGIPQEDYEKDRFHTDGINTKDPNQVKICLGNFSQAAEKTGSSIEVRGTDLSGNPISKQITLETFEQLSNTTETLAFAQKLSREGEALKHDLHGQQTVPKDHTRLVPIIQKSGNHR